MKSNGKKPARTVHIDVYCTGSDAEDESCKFSLEFVFVSHVANCWLYHKCVFPNIADSCSGSTGDKNYLDIESNSTPQTVYSSRKLHHKRITKPSELPRRIDAFKAPQEQRLSPASLRQNQLREYLLQQCDPKDEIIDSKRMLVDKYMEKISEDMAVNQTKLKQRSNVGRDQSDECVCSTYPNSSRSTMRDLTCSSISSTITQCMSHVCDDSTNISQKMNENDSKANAPYLEQPLFGPRTNRSLRPKDPLVTIQTSDYHSQANTQCFSSRKYLDRVKQLHRGKSVESSEPIATTTIRDGDGLSNSLSNGYTREHLLRAEKFGSVIRIIRKPGHHVGPTKNPDCKCAHCRRWFDERRNFRERASSIDVVSSTDLSTLHMNNWSTIQTQIQYEYCKVLPL